MGAKTRPIVRAPKRGWQSLNSLKPFKMSLMKSNNGSVNSVRNKADTFEIQVITVLIIIKLEPTQEQSL